MRSDPCASQSATFMRRCESRGGRPGLPVPNIPYVLFGRTATFEEVSASQSSGAV